MLKEQILPNPFEIEITPSQFEKFGKNNNNHIYRMKKINYISLNLKIH